MVGGSGEIQGIAVMNQKIFVVRIRQAVLEIYNELTFLLEDRFEVDGLSEPRDIASCSHRGCLYVNDYVKTIYRIDGYCMKHVIRWSVCDNLQGLSVSCRKTCNLLVTCKRGTLYEYTTYGQLIRIIRLALECISPMHAIETLNGPLLVCHGWEPAELHCVCTLDDNGDLLTSFRGISDGTDPKNFNRPVRCAVDDAGRIFIADLSNNRIVMLNPSLTSSRVLFQLKDGLQYPRRLCLDEMVGRLYVGCADKLLVLRINK